MKPAPLATLERDSKVARLAWEALQVRLASGETSPAYTKALADLERAQYERDQEAP